MDHTTAALPEGWEDRLVAVSNPNTAGATGWCLEVHDLACAKLVASRDRDFEFVRVLASERLADVATIRRRLDQMGIEPARIAAARRLVDRIEGRGA